MSVKKLLAICARDESFDDFLNIAKRINSMDTSIGVLIRSASFHPSEIPFQYLSLPLLTLYLVNPPTTLPTRGHTLCVEDLGKATEYENFLAAGFSIPRTRRYHLGEVLDPADWGPYVILKPVYGSYAIGNLLAPTAQVGELSANRIPNGHPLKTSPYLVQQYISTGSSACSYRVIALLGQPLLCVRYGRTGEITYPHSIDEIFNNYTFFSNFNQEGTTSSERTYAMSNDDEIIKFAQEVFSVHPHLPLQGIDIIREANSGKLYVLETNSGGNVWSFSLTGNPTLKILGKKALVTQFMAWDKAAEILVAKTNELAR